VRLELLLIVDRLFDLRAVAGVDVGPRALSFAVWPLNWRVSLERRRELYICWIGPFHLIYRRPLKDADLREDRK
jgi:hypothetical protein